MATALQELNNRIEADTQGFVSIPMLIGSGFVFFISPEEDKMRNTLMALGGGALVNRLYYQPSSPTEQRILTRGPLF